MMSWAADGAAARTINKRVRTGITLTKPSIVRGVAGTEARAGAELKTRRAWPVDLLHFVFFALLFTTTVASFGRVPHAAWWVAFDVAGVVLLLIVQRASARAGVRGAALLRLAHGVLVVPLVFTQVGILIHAVRDVD